MWVGVVSSLHRNALLPEGEDEMTDRERVEREIEEATEKLFWWIDELLVMPTRSVRPRIKAALLAQRREGMLAAASLEILPDEDINGWVALLTGLGAFKAGWRRYAAAIRTTADELEGE